MVIYAQLIHGPQCCRSSTSRAWTAGEGDRTTMQTFERWRQLEREADVAARAAAAGAGTPEAGVLRRRAARVRAEADRVFRNLIVQSATPGAPVAESPGGHKPHRVRVPTPNALQAMNAAVEAWTRAEADAAAAERKVVGGYELYVSGAAPLPPLHWETDAALARTKAV